jgi:NADH dehydrogenase FAD-containing subunit
VASSSELLGQDAYPATKARLKSKLERKGIHIHCNERVKLVNAEKVWTGKHVVQTNSGLEIASDLTFICIGSGTPNSEICSTLADGVLTDSGFVKVNEFLQLETEGLGHIFRYLILTSLGDVADTEASKSVLPTYKRSLCNIESYVVARNIIAAIDKKPLTTFKGSPDVILSIVLSPYDAIGQVPYVPGIIADLAIIVAKSRVFFVT